MDNTIHFTQNFPQEFNDWIKAQTFTQLCVLSDMNTCTACYPLLAQALEDVPHLHITIPDGEAAKNMATCSFIWQSWLEAQLDRQALIINLGGGVLGDMGGFCAATYKRGIRFVQIPTTLLAQVDASVGGKVGIDFGDFKNVVGVFEMPFAVWICSDFLQTLPARQLRSGMAEVLKHCLIADNAQWRNLPATFSPADMDWQMWVKHSIALKQQIVAKDWQEKNVRKLLNFGHTIGHALESFFLTQKPEPLLHGEAIAWGMLAESFLSVLYAGLSQASCAMIFQKITTYFPEKQLLTDSEIATIARLALQDKKNSHQQILCVLLADVGKAVYDVPITLSDIETALRYTLSYRSNEL